MKIGKLCSLPIFTQILNREKMIVTSTANNKPEESLICWVGCVIFMVIGVSLPDDPKTIETPTFMSP